ncbi:hypothetical protein [Kitasatospora griseola]|uniref:hypothetical protein n=1 Tax=Kitasatospora griseola TaxID=2064 RepID=UPI003436DB2C
MTTPTSALTETPPQQTPAEPAFFFPPPVRHGAPESPQPGLGPEPSDDGQDQVPDLPPPPGPDPDDEPDGVYLDEPQTEGDEDQEEERGGVAAVPLLINGVNFAVVALTGGAYYGGVPGMVATGTVAAAGAGLAGAAAVRAARNNAKAAAKTGGAAKKAGNAGRNAGRAADGATRGIAGLLNGHRSTGSTGRGGGRGGNGSGSSRSNGIGSLFGSGAGVGGGGRGGSRTGGPGAATGTGLGMLGTTSGRGSTRTSTGYGSGPGAAGTKAGGRGSTSGSGSGSRSSAGLTSAAGRSSTLGRGGSNSRSGTGAAGSGGVRGSGPGRSGIDAARNRQARNGERPQVLQDFDRTKAAAGRGTRTVARWGRNGAAKAWTSTAAARRYARKAAARWATYLARTTTAGFLATLAALAVAPLGLAAGVVANALAVMGKRGFSGFGLDWPARVWRKVWNKLGAGARAKREERRLADLAYGDEVLGDGEDDVAHEVDDPGNTTTERAAGKAAPTSKGEHVSVFAQSAEEVAELYRGYEPPLMASVAAEYRGLPGAIRHVGAAVLALAENSATQYPMDPKMAEKVSEVAQILENTAAFADEIEPVFRQAHAEDLLRHEKPRPGEAMWNVGGLTGDGSLWYSASVLETTAEQVRTVYNDWSPAGMGMGAGAMAVGAEYEGIPAGLEHLAETAISIATRSAEIWPVEQVITDMVNDVVIGLRQAVSASMELQPAFRRLHARDIDNNENPRNGEEMWNVDGGGA